jgi:steroid 5-alpha reductase family enzyme
VSLAASLLWAWAAVASFMAALWAVQWRRGNAGIVDVAWSCATGITAVWLVFWVDGDAARRTLVGALAAAWSVRLGVHLWKRVASEAEDGRYRYLREHLGDRVQPAMFAFFQVQALWALMFALPMWAAASAPRGRLDWIDALGIAIWVGALTGEAIADRQLARFRADPANRGKVCGHGLWAWSRHPNYFFEWLHWFAWVLIAAGSTYWWVTAAGVVMIYLFLTRVTGIPFTEAQSLRSRGDAYRAYQRTTPAFFPRPPTDDRTDTHADQETTT